MFGKDQSRIQSLGGNWTQRAKAHAAKKSGGRGGGGGGFHWRDNLQITEEMSGDFIRVIDGNFLQEFLAEDGETVITDTLPYLAIREHTDFDKHSCICSGGVRWFSKEFALECPSCVEFWACVAERKAKKARGDTSKGPNRMNVTDKSVWPVWDYGWYSQVSDTNKEGQLSINPKTQQPYTSWVKGHPQLLAQQGRQVHAWKQGHLIPWVLYETQKTWLMGENLFIGQGCKSCGARDAIVCAAKVCRGCRAPIYDPNNTTLTREQREQLEKNPFTCPQCKLVAFIDEQLYCRQCPNPVRTSIFDVVLQVQKQMLADNKSMLRRINHSDPQPLLEAMDLKPIIEKFKPTPPETQRSFMRLTAAAVPQQQVPGPNSYQPQGMQQGQSWGVPPQQQQPMIGWPQSQVQQPQMLHPGQSFNPAQFGAPTNFGGQVPPNVPDFGALLNRK